LSRILSQYMLSWDELVASCRSTCIRLQAGCNWSLISFIQFKHYYRVSLQLQGYYRNYSFTGTIIYHFHLRPLYHKFVHLSKVIYTLENHTTTMTISGKYRYSLLHWYLWAKRSAIAGSLVNIITSIANMNVTVNGTRVNNEMKWKWSTASAF